MKKYIYKQKCFPETPALDGNRKKTWSRDTSAEINRYLANTLMIVLWRKPKLLRHIKLHSPKYHSLLNKKLLSLSAPFSVYTYSDLCFLGQWQSFCSSWTQSSAEFLKILSITNNHLCCKYFCFLVWKLLSSSLARYHYLKIFVFTNGALVLLVATRNCWIS